MEKKDKPAKHGILGGVQLGFHTVLVLSGGTRRADLPRYPYRPDVVVDSLAELADLLEEATWRPPWHAPTRARSGTEKRPTALAR